jgi:predicted nucleic acid-binding protein
MKPPGAPPLLVDTDVISFRFRQDTRSTLYRPHLEGRVLAVSFVTVAELEQWARTRNWGPARQAELAAHITDFTLLHSNRDLCRWWAAVSVEARRAGRPIQASDAWIAATALLYDMPLVTHNPHDFAGVAGLEVITETSR